MAPKEKKSEPKMKSGQKIPPEKCKIEKGSNREIVRRNASKMVEDGYPAGLSVRVSLDSAAKSAKKEGKLAPAKRPDPRVEGFKNENKAAKKNK